MMRTLSGVDLPSFMAPRIMPPASKANSRSEKSVGDRRRRSRGSVSHRLLGGVMTILLHLHLDHRVHRAGVRRIGGRPIRDDADLADDQFHIVADFFMNHLLDGGDSFFRFLNARAGSRPHVHLEGAGVHFREELAA